MITKKNPTKDEIDELAEEVEFNVKRNMKGEVYGRNDMKWPSTSVGSCKLYIKNFV